MDPEWSILFTGPFGWAVGRDLRFSGTFSEAVIAAEAELPARLERERAWYADVIAPPREVSVVFQIRPVVNGQIGAPHHHV